MITRRFFIALVLGISVTFCTGIAHATDPSKGDVPYVLVLGVAQDGGAPQAGDKDHPAWTDVRLRRRVSCLAIVDGTRRWMIDCTPDFREQLQMLDRAAPVVGTPGLDGIFLTHGHMGHYTGLMFLGHESMGAKAALVYTMPEMRAFLESSGPWRQLVDYGNIQLSTLEDGRAVRLTSGIRVTPFRVPHRQEYSEVVGYRIDGPRRSVLFIPDIDRWETWDKQGTRVEDLIAEVDVAYLDGTFYADGEIPGRDMSTFPHPFIAHSMKRFATMPAGERAKIRFIHLNHTNPALKPNSAARRTIEKNGFRVAEEKERVEL